LAENVSRNAPTARVEKLVWGCDDPLAKLGLGRKPDLVLASDVVYGNDPEKWELLVKTMRDLSGPNTLIVVGNVQRYPINHPMAESRFFQTSTSRDFNRKEVPARSLHVDFQKTGGGSCVVHVFRRKADVGDGDVLGKRKGDGETKIKEKKEKRRKE
jgi:hypothetical protein